MSDELEKGKAGQLGEIRTWSGKKYQKTAKGWRPVKKGTQESSSSGEIKEEKSLKADNDWVKTIREYTACGGGNFGKVLERKPNGDLVVEYIRRGEKPWTDVAKKGSEDWKHLKDEKPSMQKESSDEKKMKVKHVNAENLKPGDKVYDWEDIDFDTDQINPGAKPSGVVKKVTEFKNGFGEVVGAQVMFDDGETSVLRGTLIVQR